MVKKAKTKLKSRKRPQTSESNVETVFSSSIDTETQSHAIEVVVESQPLVKVSSSPKKVIKRASLVPKSSSIVSGPVLSKFFAVVRKENDVINEELIDHESQLQLERKVDVLSGFWSYFPKFFVKPNVKMAKLPGYAPSQKTQITCAISEILEKGDAERHESKEIEQLSLLPMVRFKLFHFAENIRPCYFGTFSKRSFMIRGRRPFVKDLSKDLELDYSIESDNEWEDDCDELEGEIENLSDTDQSDTGSEDEDSNDEDEDSSWLVPHGYLSEDEMMCDDGDERNPIFAAEDMNDPVSRKRLQDSWRLGAQSSTTLALAPKIYSSLRLTSEQDILYLSSFSMRPFMDLFSLNRRICPKRDGVTIDNLTGAFRMIEAHDMLHDHSSLFKKKKKRKPTEAILDQTNQDSLMHKHTSDETRQISIPQAISIIPIEVPIGSSSVDKENTSSVNVQLDSNSKPIPMKRITPIMISGE